MWLLQAANGAKTAAPPSPCPRMSHGTLLTDAYGSHCHHLPSCTACRTVELPAGVVRQHLCHPLSPGFSAGACPLSAETGVLLALPQCRKELAEVEELCPVLSLGLLPSQVSPCALPPPQLSCRSICVSFSLSICMLRTKCLIPTNLRHCSSSLACPPPPPNSADVPSLKQLRFVLPGGGKSVGLST